MLAKFLDKILPITEVTCHCDIPCGIYDPRDAIQAAQTVVRMTELLEELDYSNGPSASLGNSMARFVAAKEEHAKKAKDDILVIWTDYFKPEHLSAFPDLHETFWKAAKLCSACKVNIDESKAQELMNAVEKIHHMFWTTKGRSVAWITAS